MKRNSVLVVFILVLVCVVPSLALTEDDAIKAEIEKSIDSAYLNTFWNKIDEEGFLNGWAPSAISPGKGRDENLFFVSVWDWYHSAKNRPDTGKKYDFRYPVIDVAGDMAIAKVEVVELVEGGEKLLYTDYFPLFKFKSGWKIAGYPYYPHRNGQTPSAEGEEEAVKQVVEKTFINSIFKQKNADEYKKGFAELVDYNLFIPDYDAVVKEDYGLFANILRAPINFYPLKNYDISFIGITGHVAGTKLTISTESDKSITMYVVLYKIGGEWKIINLNTNTKLMSLAQIPSRGN